MGAFNSELMGVERTSCRVTNMEYLDTSRFDSEDNAVWTDEHLSEVLSRLDRGFQCDRKATRPAFEPRAGRPYAMHELASTFGRINRDEVGD